MLECVGCSCLAAEVPTPGEVLARGGWRPVAVDIWDVLVDPRAPRSDWSINQMLAIELAAYLDRVRPPRILEVGSGYSTAILAAYAAHHGAEVVTLEHDPNYYRATRRALHRLGVDRHLDLRLAPLKQHWFGHRGPYWWYDHRLDGEFDFVFIDGPPKVLGRRGAFFALQGHLRPGWRVWVDDGSRRHERQCVRLWGEEFSGSFLETRWDIDGKGVFDLRDAAGARDQAADAATGRLAIGVLGHGDPNWWARVERTLGSGVLGPSRVVAVDRGQPPGRLPKAAAGFVDDRLPAGGPLPDRRLRLLRSLVAPPEVRYVLYLDDRWSPSTLDTTWLRRALEVLEQQPDVQQVSLGHLVDLAVDARTGRRSLPGPFPHEPSLLGADRLREALQANGRARRSRPAAARQPAPLWSVQLTPGVFRRRDVADGPAEAPSCAVDGQPLPLGVVVRKARTLVAAAARRLGAARGDGLEDALVDVGAAAGGQPAGGA
jgi:choline dehydrogenase-like flavoprotein